MLLPRTRLTLTTWLALLGLFAPLVARAEPRLAYVKSRTIYTARARDGKGEKRVCKGLYPCISHDGRFVAYLRDGGPARFDPATSTRTVVVRDLASGQEVDLPNGPHHQAGDARWSPDDTWVDYSAEAEKGWQVAAAHPDGSGFHFLTDTLPNPETGYFMAGWNLHDSAVLVHNYQVALQLDPATGQAAWTRLLSQLTGEEHGSSAAQYTISVDGRLISTRPTETPEIPALMTNMSCDYLMVADLADVKPQRLTPKRFAVLDPYVSTDGRSVYLVGIRGREVKVKRGGDDGDNLDVKQRVYRYDLPTGKLTPLVEEGAYPSVSRD